jgi:hypothetical protein
MTQVQPEVVKHYDYDSKENIAGNHTSRGCSQLGHERVSLFQW